MKLSKILLSHQGRDYLAQNNFERAREVFRTMTQLYPEEGVGFANLGQCCFELGDHAGAITNYEKALEIDGDKFAILMNRLYLLYRNACMYKKAEILAKRLDNSGIEEPLISLFKDESYAKNLKIAKQRSRRYKSNLIFDHSTRSKNMRIKIGYLSYDFRDHPIAQVIAKVLKEHDKKTFEVHLFSTGPNDESVWRQKIIKSSKHFYDCSNLSDSQLSRLINEVNIDILIDLNGHTNGSRQFALVQKPAPDIVNFLGFSGSMGSTYHDYIIADKTIIDKNEEKYFTEKVRYMPHCFHPTNDNWDKVNHRITREKIGLPQDVFILSCFIETLRIDLKDLLIWCKILNKIPNSVLWLKKNEQAKYSILQIMKSHNIEESRVFWAERTETKSEYFERLTLVDLALDTSIYTGHTTTLDYLWSGVPVVARKGRHFAGRVASSILTTLGMSELITYDKSEYINLAVKIALDKSYHKLLKDKIAKRIKVSPLFDTKKYTRDLESLYKGIYATRNTV